MHSGSAATETIVVLRPRGLLHALLILLSAGALTAQAAVHLEDRVEHYTISGSTPADLRRDMNAKGPQGAGGRRFDGYTRWYVSWRYQYKKGEGRCAIASITTHVKVTMTLPRWRNEENASSSVRQQWRRYLSALKQHERGHHRHGIDAANEVDRAIGAMPPAANCDALGANANALGMGILRKYNQLDLDYDRDTRHGATQGARFP
jgi:predicted secreted Zn-dependent protease